MCDEGILRCQVRMEEARRILVQFGRPVPGRDEPTDGALDEGEIQAFQEQMAELLDDIEQ